MRRLRTTSPSHATSALAVLTLLGTITACSMFGANTAVAASPPAQSPHHAGVVLDSGTSSNSNAGISQTTGSNSSHGSGGSTGSTGASVPKGLESFYHQDLTWTDCTDDATGTAFQCATVTVPLDYDNPQGQTITVALKKLPSTSSSPRGSVFLNPGGPGGSGISVIESQAELYKSGDLSEVLANYDVIGFDPRGVGQSTPITCWTPEDVQAILAGQAEMPSLSTPDTRSVARDMDVMRALVGDKDLNYLGYSYGTYLGAVYTELFPDNIGRVVLDSAMDPTMARQDPMEGDAAAGEQSLRTYIESQQGQAGFPLSGTTDAAVAQLATFLDGLDADPLTVSGSGTPLNRAKAVDAISKLVTTSPDKWPLLTEGLTQAMNAHDGSALKANADAVSGNSAPPTTEKQVVEQLQGLKVFSANRCLDFPDAGNESSWDAALASYHHDYPVFHSLLPQYDAFCHGWGHTSRTEAVDVDVEATNPMLVIGILHDPQTPYPWSKALVSKIRNSHLLSVDMYGHGATGSNACTSAKVSDYLVNGTLPSDGEICPADPEPQAGGGEKG